MPIAIDAAVDHLLQGRDGHRPIPPLSDKHPELSMVEAYSVQRALEQALVLRGERVIGWKAGFTNAAIQGQYGVTEPVLGFMLGSGVFSGGDSIPIDRFASVGVEVEVAFLLKRDLAGPGVTPVSALLAVEGAMPSLELIDFRCSGKPRGADVVADGVFANAIVLGRPLTPVAALDLALEGVVFEQNGQVVATNTAAEVMGNPLTSLAWLANTLGRMGRGLAAGDVVLSGSISKVLRPEQGESVRASFTRLGAVSCRFV
ncbi:MAG TPA: fumarylacetoacetate hydrolase family protein [Candidatus Nitrosocosmicus sp.]|jgi:2-keto-4-pentenoate hydratase|nr:fumarylacetoacetate hydrolase family protein [Candidatus Nitrosocosmicus sp.]